MKFDESKKIALIVANLGGGGAERMMLNLAKGFANRGLKIDLVLSEALGPYLSEVPYNVNIVDLNSKRVLFSLFKLFIYFKKVQPEFVISTLNRIHIAVILSKTLARAKTKVILREANTFSANSNSNLSTWEKIIDFITIKFYHKGDAYVAVSNGVAEDLIKHLKLDKNKVHLIYNPVVDNTIMEKSVEPVDHPWLLNKDIHVILGIGRISEQKDFITLIKAFNEVLRKKNVRLILLGNKNEESQEFQKVTNCILELNLEDKVSLHGFVENPFAFLSKASVFVLSSKWEGLPGVLIQALACGCPVVSTDCPSGPNEIINSPEIGYLSPVGNFNLLAENILKVLESDFDKKKIVSRANDFNIDKATDSYLELIASLNKVY